MHEWPSLCSLLCMSDEFVCFGCVVGSFRGIVGEDGLCVVVVTTNSW
jgi:hypothetical protein